MVGDFEYELSGGGSGSGQRNLPPGSPSSESSDGIDMQIGLVAHAGLSAPLNQGPSYALGPPDMQNGLTSMQGVVERLTRGCKGYEKQMDELHTEVDLTALVADMKRQGVSVSFRYCSMNEIHESHKPFHCHRAFTPLWMLVTTWATLYITAR